MTLINEGRFSFPTFPTFFGIGDLDHSYQRIECLIKFISRFDSSVISHLGLIGESKYKTNYSHGISQTDFEILQKHKLAIIDYFNSPFGVNGNFWIDLCSESCLFFRKYISKDDFNCNILLPNCFNGEKSVCNASKNIIKSMKYAEYCEYKNIIFIVDNDENDEFSYKVRDEFSKNKNKSNFVIKTISLDSLKETGDIGMNSLFLPCSAMCYKYLEGWLDSKSCINYSMIIDDNRFFFKAGREFVSLLYATLDLFLCLGFREKFNYLYSLIGKVLIEHQDKNIDIDDLINNIILKIKLDQKSNHANLDRIKSEAKAFSFDSSL